ncbi:hypothetical protein MFLAVUS_007097 [Mucor flavus]|uniref:Tc1-like transposase DDE domain-containing protein n=1 Tax=Mucor flavus TaxID=439312 RepID=A0ABP9Z3D2_9FUNG
MSYSFYYEDGIGTLRNEDNVIVDDPMEDIHTNITDPRIVLETITSHKQYQKNKPAEKSCWNTPSAYSPELNPIENFWSLIKGKTKRVFFAVGETMTSRIRAACEDTHPSELYAFADHSKRQIKF